jgi:hypothetical protein
MTYYFIMCFCQPIKRIWQLTNYSRNKKLFPFQIQEKRQLYLSNTRLFLGKKKRLHLNRKQKTQKTRKKIITYLQILCWPCVCKTKKEDTQIRLWDPIYLQKKFRPYVHNTHPKPIKQTNKQKKKSPRTPKYYKKTPMKRKIKA